MIITCSKLITCNKDRATSDDSAVVISRGIITAVGQSKKISQRFRGHRILHLNDAVLMPGLVNTHAHLELPPLLSQIKSRTFSGWILGLIRAKKLLDDKDYSSSARENINALIRNGTTTVGEICSHAISPALLKASGLRAVVFREIINMDRLVMDEKALRSNPPHPMSDIQASSPEVFHLTRLIPFLKRFCVPSNGFHWREISGSRCILPNPKTR